MSLAIKGLVFDIDGTLTKPKAKNAWTYLTASLPINPESAMAEHFAFYTKIKSGEMEPEVGLKRVVELWSNQNLNFEVAMSQLQIDFRDESCKVIDYITNDLNLPVALISGSFQQYVSKVAESLGVPHYYGNGWIDTDETGVPIGIVDFYHDEDAYKVTQMQQLASKWQIPINQFAFIGNDTNDWLAMQQAGLAINIGEIKPEFDHVHIDTLDEVIAVILKLIQEA